MNAESSAWGRAIVAVLAADTKRGIASAQEVRSKNVSHNDTQNDEKLVKELNDKINYAKNVQELDAYAEMVKRNVESGDINQQSRKRLADAYLAKKAKLETVTPIPPSIQDTLAEFNAVDASKNPEEHIKAIKQQLKA
jgi:sensor domain CHASE-containing protein